MVAGEEAEREAASPGVALSAQRSARWFAGGGLLMLLALAPLHLGGNRLDSFTLIALAAALLGVIAVFADRPVRGRRKRVGKLILIGVASYGLALAWALIQASSWTPDVLHHPLWASTAKALGRPVEGSISLSPEAGLEGVMRLSSYLAVFLCAFQLCQRRRFAFLLLRAVVVIGTAYGIVALFRLAVGADHVLWFEDATQVGVATGSFVNRNSFAAYMVMCLLVGGMLLVRFVGRVPVEEQTSRLVLRRLMQSLELWRGLALVSAIILFVCLLLTASKAATALGLMSFLVLIGSAWASGILNRRPMMLMGGVVLLAVLLGVSSIGSTLDRRLGQLASASLDNRDFNRLRVDGLTLEAIGDRPLIGSGLGSFRAVFSGVRDADFRVLKSFGQAHNSYLENILELGMPGALLLLMGPALAGLLFVRALRSGRGSRSIPCLGLALLCFAGVYSLMDFPLEIPANAVLFAAVLGLCCAQASPASEGSSPSD